MRKSDDSMRIWCGQQFCITFAVKSNKEITGFQIKFGMTKVGDEGIPSQQDALSEAERVGMTVKEKILRLRSE